jgi:hypothetical protein
LSDPVSGYEVHDGGNPAWPLVLGGLT